MASDRFGAFLSSLEQPVRRALEELRRRIAVTEEGVAGLQGDVADLQGITVAARYTVGLSWSGAASADVTPTGTITIPSADHSRRAFLSAYCLPTISTVGSFDFFLGATGGGALSVRTRWLPTSASAAQSFICTSSLLIPANVADTVITTRLLATGVGRLTSLAGSSDHNRIDVVTTRAILPS